MFALTKAAFPDLRVPTPFVFVRANEISPFPMPFVRASLVIEPYDKDDDSCTDIFDTWCLWDTGAQSSMILSRMLSKEVKGGEEEGYASLVIRFAGTSNRIETSVGFRENLPNGTNFVILGQHALLNCIRSEIVPKIFNGAEAGTYGNIKLLEYMDPLENISSSFTPIMQS